MTIAAPHERMAGKVAVVTGGATGLGRTVCSTFAAHGAAVIIAGRNVEAGRSLEAEIRADGGQARFVRTDITSIADVHNAVNTAVQSYGSLTTLVNNAAGLDLGGADGPIASIDPDQWNALIMVNLTGAYLCTRAAVPHIIAAGGGSIVSVSSLAGVMGLRDMTAYSTAKSGLIGMMRAVSVDYGRKRVRANTVVLGVVPHDHLAFINDGKVGDSLREVHALPYLGQVDDLALACLYLCSDESKFVTGTELRVDGGATRIRHREGERGVYNTVHTSV